MRKTVEAVYERGALRPLEPLDLEEGQRVELDLLTPDQRAEEVLRRAARVVEGLTADDLAEVERIALDRGGWHRP